MRIDIVLIVRNRTSLNQANRVIDNLQWHAEPLVRFRHAHAVALEPHIQSSGSKQNSRIGQKMTNRLDDAVRTLQRLAPSGRLTGQIAKVEQACRGKNVSQIAAYIEEEGLGHDELLAALAVKAIAGQINVVIHTLGILVSLPFILEEDKVVETLSLGAGNTGRRHDLETDRRIAEFTAKTVDPISGELADAH